MQASEQILPAVAVAIFNDKGEVLLQKRRDVNQWCIISGHVEFGESVQEAVLREIWEETSVSGEIIRFLGVYSSPASQTYHYKDRTVQYITSYFEARLTAPLIAGYHNEETEELKFFPLDHIPENLATINPFWLSDAMSTGGEIFMR
ncbi:NUDIX domain-containing protein [Emticicia sp. CRIBPO]|uniref:NUDIX domain-containing protein n=1 Tax=Emticicia sp. CRIBPO TaxID=2683258 RepID=UPI0014121C76|nr:NUDIX domain-containing protein [Emticicia sp. CRIBPO]NBA86781.1 NUDIX domain-containing protein [Emticicia sp. CRIBPO]